MRKFQPTGRRTPLTAAQKRGYKSKINGRKAEEFLLNTDIEGLVYKRYEPYRRLTGGKIFKAQATEKSGCDYSVFTPFASGMIEVKSREADRIALSALDDTQHAQLEQLSTMGCIALVLVRLRGQWYCIPYPIFKVPAKGKSWGLVALRPYLVDEVDGKLLLNTHLLRHYT